MTSYSFNKSTHVLRLIKIAIALVWLINGLYCKVLGFVPRHEQIVARILGNDYSYWLTKAIGCSEILMAIWILSNIKPRLCTWSQIAIVMTMNIIEFTLAPDLLLHGHLNILFAILFCIVVYFV